MVDEERAAAGRGRAAGLEAARAAFYRGDLAAAMADYHRENGGWLTREDLAGYESAFEAPVRTEFHGTEVYTCGAWCQGPVMQQMLSLLAGYDLAALGHNSAEYVHLVAEAMKLAFADRERYYGDPRHVDVPLEALLSGPYAEARRRLIDPARAWPEMPPAGEAGGAPTVAGGYTAAAGSPAASADTSYCCAVDEAGNLFSATPSDVSWEGPIIPGTGLAPSSRGSQSWAVAGHPSCVAPGKRPRLTPNPAIAIVPGAGRPRIGIPFGTPGGDNQPQAMLQVLLNHRVFGMPIQEAIEAPRFMIHSIPNSFEPHRYLPGKLTVEGRIEPAVSDRLAALGHDVERLEDMTYKTAGVCAIVADHDRGILEGGADPRRMSRAMGW
jgi:gamma-glutamyltranspeptidase/glutathione hydrolase